VTDDVRRQPYTLPDSEKECVVSGEMRRKKVKENKLIEKTERNSNQTKQTMYEQGGEPRVRIAQREVT